MPRYVRHEYGILKIATEKELLDFANKIRKAGGANALDALLPSVMADENACLIANALNFSCSIQGIDDIKDYEGNNWSDHYWMILPKNMTKKRRTELANGVDLKVYRVGIMAYDLKRTFSYHWALELPAVISNSARAFDYGVAFTKYARKDDIDE